MNNPQIPAARKQGLVIQELPDEVLVYDLETNKAHCLNQTAAFVWKSCDGKNSVADISRKLGTANGNGSVREEMIRLAIDQLNERNLLESRVPVNFQGQSRREVIKKVGLAAIVALPVVTSLVAPAAAAAGSVCQQSCTCTLAAMCAAGAGNTCACSGSGTSANGCVAPCNGGCGGCQVVNGASSCNGLCQA